MLYGLIGYPVSHSLSSFMHNAAFSALGIDGHYELFETKPAELGLFFEQAIKQKQILGFNVTIPHKENVLQYVNTTLPPEVELIGAANTIKVAEGGKLISCLNTDGAGFRRHLQELGFTIANSSVGLIGAGGAAKAVSVFIAKDKPKKITIFDIDQTKAKDLTLRLKTHFSAQEVVTAESVDSLGVSELNILVNATPVGMKDTDPCLVDSKLFKKEMLVYDLIYNPKQTKLLAAAEKAGAKTSNGLKMLLYQGVLAFEYWTGKSAPEEVMWKALLSHIHQN